MADEQTKPPFNKQSIIIPNYDWKTLQSKDGIELELQYLNTLTRLASEKGMLGDIFRKSQNKIQDPAKLKRLIELINEETWLGLDVDIKGAAYEGLLQKNAEEGKKGAGQYFTPRPLIKAIVEVMKPLPNNTICDPACGTGGFFLAAHEYISTRYQLDKEQKDFLKYRTFRGWDIVQAVVRLCVMNLYLHGIGGDTSPITVDDSLRAHPGEYFDMVLTNPPFGRKSSYTVVNDEGEANRESQTYERPDFWATTGNKQLNFLQHVRSLLKQNGRAAIVVPDNVLFEGGAGETIRKKILSECDVHTLLRLPRNVFYAQGVKANVLFFDRKPASETSWTKELWIYDLRTNTNLTLKNNPLTLSHLQDFIKCYNPENRLERLESERFHRFTYDELVNRDKANLDITWLRDESLEENENLPEPEVIAAEIIDNLRSTLYEFEQLQEELEKKE
jgi:type I restriction enzyme M protein